MHHGEARNHRMVHDHDVFEGTLPNGETVRLPGSGRSYSVCEQWCSVCKAWFEVKGVMGALHFMFEHDAKRPHGPAAS